MKYLTFFSIKPNIKHNKCEYSYTDLYTEGNPPRAIVIYLVKGIQLYLKMYLKIFTGSLEEYDKTNI